MRELEHFQNLVEMFFRRASRKQDAPFLSVKQERRWRTLSWEETAGQVGRLAVALRRIGLHTGDRVMLVSENRPEWCIPELAIMAGACVNRTAPTGTAAPPPPQALWDWG